MTEPYSQAELGKIVGDLTTLVVRFRRHNPDETSMTLRVPRSVHQRCFASRLDLTKAVKVVSDRAGVDVTLVLVADEVGP